MMISPCGSTAEEQSLLKRIHFSHALTTYPVWPTQMTDHRALVLLLLLLIKLPFAGGDHIFLHSGSWLNGLFVYKYWWMQYSHWVEHSCVQCANENGCWNVVTVSSFQDPNQLIRASALRVLSSIRVPMIVPIVMLAIKDSASDMSPYVRKTAAHAIPKLYRYSAFL